MILRCVPFGQVVKFLVYFFCQVMCRRRSRYGFDFMLCLVQRCSEWGGLVARNDGKEQAETDHQGAVGMNTNAELLSYPFYFPRFLLQTTLFYYDHISLADLSLLNLLWGRSLKWQRLRRSTHVRQKVLKSHQLRHNVGR